MPIPGAMIWKEAGCVWVNEQLDNFKSELAGATWKVASSRVNWWELLRVRQELGEDKREG
jgi:hypothetical protein